MGLRVIKDIKISHITTDFTYYFKQLNVTNGPILNGFQMDFTAVRIYVNTSTSVRTVSIFDFFQMLAHLMRGRIFHASTRPIIRAEIKIKIKTTN